MTVDWTVLELPGVDEVARRAAGKVASDYSVAIEPEDAYQEALIRLAQMPERVRECVNGVGGANLGILYHELRCDLVDRVKTDATHRRRHVSYERAREVGE